jgi:hypothetical protein
MTKIFIKSNHQKARNSPARYWGSKKRIPRTSFTYPLLPAVQIMDVDDTGRASVLLLTPKYVEENARCPRRLQKLIEKAMLVNSSYIIEA